MSRAKLELLWKLFQWVSSSCWRNKIYKNVLAGVETRMTCSRHHLGTNEPKARLRRTHIRARNKKTKKLQLSFNFFEKFLLCCVSEKLSASAWPDLIPWDLYNIVIHLLFKLFAIQKFNERKSPDFMMFQSYFETFAIRNFSYIYWNTNLRNFERAVKWAIFLL